MSGAGYGRYREVGRFRGIFRLIRLRKRIDAVPIEERLATVIGLRASPLDSTSILYVETVDPDQGYEVNINGTILHMWGFARMKLPSFPASGTR